MTRLDLQARLLLGLGTLFVSALLVLGWVLVDEARESGDRFRFEHATYQSKTLAAASTDALIAEDYELLERWVRAALPSADYAYAALVRPNGQVLTHTDVVLIGRLIDTTPTPEPGQWQGRYRNRPVKEIRSPVVIGRKHLANAHVAYYLDTGVQLSPESRYKIVLTLLVGLGLLVLGAAILSRKLFRPLNALTATVTQVSFDRPLELDPRMVARDDEVGALATAFQDMSRRLTQSYGEIRDHSRLLEQRVDERTHELLEANRDLEASRARMAGIMDHVADGVITIDEQGRIESFNRAAEKLFGYEAREVVGAQVSMLMPEEHGLKHGQYVQRYLDTGEGRIIGKDPRELTARRKDGTLFPIDLAVSVAQLVRRKLFIGIVRDITERKAMVDGLRHVAAHDALTGLANRRYFHDELGRALERKRRGQTQPGAVLFIDLDNFKHVNDRYGHAAGDRVLVEVTNILTSRVRKSDLLARLGGDEFAVLIHETSRELVTLIAESFRQHIASYHYRQDGADVEVGGSIGVAMIDAHAGSVDEVMARADAACYEAKRAGRNRVHFPGSPSGESTVSD
jgi:diguanylate cyclase (GGDEF)-like protein/PAS domain S-box-containing protein